VVFPLLNVRQAFGDSGRPWWTRLTDVLVAAACVLSIWYAFSLHFLSLGLNY
jgi:hypothetical protein